MIRTIGTAFDFMLSFNEKKSATPRSCLPCGFQLQYFDEKKGATVGLIVRRGGSALSTLKSVDSSYRAPNMLGDIWRDSLEL